VISQSIATASPLRKSGIILLFLTTCFKVCAGKVFFFCYVGYDKFDMINNVWKTSGVLHVHTVFFLKIYEPAPTSRQQNGHMDHPVYWQPTNIWCNCIKFNHQGDLSSEICGPTVINLYTNPVSHPLHSYTTHVIPQTLAEVTQLACTAVSQTLRITQYTATSL
jgi:hypothetical protein